VPSLSPEDAAAAVARASGVPGAQAGRYDAFHVNERAAAPFDPESPGDPVVFVNCMRFAPEQHDAAFAAWERVNRYMVEKPGYRWHRLHRRLHDDAPFGLVNVVEWESPEAWLAAHDEGFRALTGGDLPFTAYPTLCRSVGAQPGSAETRRSEPRSAPAREMTGAPEVAR
jgi:heme-degrading monooxygenase HmoA